MAVGLTLAVVAQVVFTMCEFVVKYAFSVAMNGGVGARPVQSLFDDLSLMAERLGSEPGQNLEDEATGAHGRI